MPSETTWIDVPGGRLAADDRGEGPPILLVHSAVVNRRAWDPVVPLLVDAGYWTIAYDMRGYGESSSEDVEFVAYEDLLAVADHFGLGRVALVGNSMGAHWSLDAVVAAPDRFVALVFIGGGINGYAREHAPHEVPVFQAESDAEDAADWDLAAELDTRIWGDGWTENGLQPPTRLDPAVRAAIKAMDRQLLEPGRVYGKPKRPEPPAIERLDSISVPTLAVVGDLDTTGTRQNARRLVEGVRGSRLVELPNVAHIVGMEVPATLAALIVEHLAPLPRWS